MFKSCNVSPVIPNISTSSISQDSKLPIYTIFDEITPLSVSSIIEDIIKANISPSENAEMITLLICSPGGDLTAGYALIDTMQGSKIPITTIGLGMIASAALMIFMAGDKGNRILTPNTLIMSHQWSCFTGGKYHELMAQRKYHDIITENVIRFYKKHSTIKNTKTIESLLLPPTDVYLTPEEALKYGLCDRIEPLTNKLYTQSGR